MKNTLANSAHGELLDQHETESKQVLLENLNLHGNISDYQDFCDTLQEQIEIFFTLPKGLSASSYMIPELKQKNLNKLSPLLRNRIQTELPYEVYYTLESKDDSPEAMLDRFLRIKDTVKEAYDAIVERYAPHSQAPKFSEN